MRRETVLNVLVAIALAAFAAGMFIGATSQHPLNSPCERPHPSPVSCDGHRPKTINPKETIR